MSRRGRKSPYRHVVHTRDPRYSVNRYGRGVGEPPPRLPRTDSRSSYGMGLENREGVTKTHHAWRIDDSLSPQRKRVFDEKNADWMMHHNRRDVRTIDHPSSRDPKVRLLIEREHVLQRVLNGNLKRKQTLERIMGKSGGGAPKQKSEIDRLRQKIAETKAQRDRVHDEIETLLGFPNKPLRLVRRESKKYNSPMVKNTDQLTGHTSAETAHVIEDYPYGRGIRTKLRMWVETKEKLGQRVITQTLNPRTGKWNKPKPSTYSPVVLLMKEKQPDGRVFVRPKYLDVHIDTKVNEILGWKKEYDLDDYQSKMVDRMAVSKNAQKYVEVTVVSSGMLDLSKPEDIAKLAEMEKASEQRKEEESRVIQSALTISRSELRNKELM